MCFLRLFCISLIFWYLWHISSYMHFFRSEISAHQCSILNPFDALTQNVFDFRCVVFIGGTQPSVYFQYTLFLIDFSRCISSDKIYLYVSWLWSFFMYSPLENMPINWFYSNSRPADFRDFYPFTVCVKLSSRYPVDNTH